MSSISSDGKGGEEQRAWDHEREDGETDKCTPTHQAAHQVIQFFFLVFPAKARGKAGDVLVQKQQGQRDLKRRSVN